MMKKSLPTMCLMAHVESAIMYLQYRVDPLNWNNVFGFFKSYHVNVNSHSHLTNFKLNYYFSTQKAILINWLHMPSLFDDWSQRDIFKKYFRCRSKSFKWTNNCTTGSHILCWSIFFSFWCCPKFLIRSRSVESFYLKI